MAADGRKRPCSVIVNDSDWHQSDNAAREHVLAVEFDTGAPDLFWCMTATPRESAGARPEHQSRARAHNGRARRRRT